MTAFSTKPSDKIIRLSIDEYMDIEKKAVTKERARIKKRLEKLMDLKTATELTEQLTKYAANDYGGCVICGNNPLKQREAILTELRKQP